MKKLTKINLHNLSQVELSNHEKNLLRGGDYPVYACVCGLGCSCLYAGEKEGDDDAYYGGASKQDSAYANLEGVRSKALDEAKSDDYD